MPKVLKRRKVFQRLRKRRQRPRLKLRLTLSNQKLLKTQQKRKRTSLKSRAELRAKRVKREQLPHVQLLLSWPRKN